MSGQAQDEHGHRSPQTASFLIAGNGNSRLVSGTGLLRNLTLRANLLVSVTSVTSRRLLSSLLDADSNHIKGWCLRTPGEPPPAGIHFNAHIVCIHHVLVKFLGARTAFKFQDPGMLGVRASGPVTPLNLLSMTPGRTIRVINMIGSSSFAARLGEHWILIRRTSREDPAFFSGWSFYRKKPPAGILVLEPGYTVGRGGREVKGGYPSRMITMPNTVKDVIDLLLSSKLLGVSCLAPQERCFLPLEISSGWLHATGSGH